jgi:DNA-binding GntR family transcriptional regulator
MRLEMAKKPFSKLTLSETWQGLLARDFHFRIAAGCGCVHGGGNLADMTLHDAPLRIAKYENGNSAAHQVLLRQHVLVRSNQNLEPGFFGGFQ